MKDKLELLYGCEEIVEVPMKKSSDILKDAINNVIDNEKEFILIDLLIVTGILILISIFSLSL